MTTQTILPPKQRLAVVKMLFEQYPDIAEILSNQLMGETDLSKLPGFLSSFCQVTKTNKTLLQGPLFKSSIIENRRLFVGAILTIYQPHTRGLSASLARLLNMHEGLLSQMIKETKVRYANNHYDFRTKADVIVQQMREV